MTNMNFPAKALIFLSGIALFASVSFGNEDKLEEILKKQFGPLLAETTAKINCAEAEQNPETTANAWINNTCQRFGLNHLEAKLGYLPMVKSVRVLVDTKGFTTLTFVDPDVFGRLEIEKENRFNYKEEARIVLASNIEKWLQSPISLIGDTSVVLDEASQSQMEADREFCDNKIQSFDKIDENRKKELVNGCVFRRFGRQLQAAILHTALFVALNENEFQISRNILNGIASHQLDQTLGLTSVNGKEGTNVSWHQETARFLRDQLYSRCFDFYQCLDSINALNVSKILRYFPELVSDTEFEVFMNAQIDAIAPITPDVNSVVALQGAVEAPEKAADAKVVGEAGATQTSSPAAQIEFLRSYLKFRFAALRAVADFAALDSRTSPSEFGKNPLFGYYLDKSDKVNGPKYVRDPKVDQIVPRYKKTVTDLISDKKNSLYQQMIAKAQSLVGVTGSSHFDLLVNAFIGSLSSVTVPRIVDDAGKTQLGKLLTEPAFSDVNRVVSTQIYVASRNKNPFDGRPGKSISFPEEDKKSFIVPDEFLHTFKSEVSSKNYASSITWTDHPAVRFETLCLASRLEVVLTEGSSWLDTMKLYGFLTADLYLRTVVSKAERDALLANKEIAEKMTAYFFGNQPALFSDYQLTFKPENENLDVVDVKVEIGDLALDSPILKVANKPAKTGSFEVRPDDVLTVIKRIEVAEKTWAANKMAVFKAIPSEVSDYYLKSILQNSLPEDLRYKFFLAGSTRPIERWVQKYYPDFQSLTYQAVQIIDARLKIDAGQDKIIFAQDDVERNRIYENEVNNYEDMLRRQSLVTTCYAYVYNLFLAKESNSKLAENLKTLKIKINPADPEAADEEYNLEQACLSNKGEYKNVGVLSDEQMRSNVARYLLRVGVQKARAKEKTSFVRVGLASLGDFALSFVPLMASIKGLGFIKGGVAKFAGVEGVERVWTKAVAAGLSKVYMGFLVPSSQNLAASAGSIFFNAVADYVVFDTLYNFTNAAGNVVAGNVWLFRAVWGADKPNAFFLKNSSYGDISSGVFVFAALPYVGKLSLSLKEKHGLWTGGMLGFSAGVGVMGASTYVQRTVDYYSLPNQPNIWQGTGDAAYVLGRGLMYSLAFGAGRTALDSQVRGEMFSSTEQISALRIQKRAVVQAQKASGIKPTRAKPEPNGGQHQTFREFAERVMFKMGWYRAILGTKPGEKLTAERIHQALNSGAAPASQIKGDAAGKLQSLK